MPSLGQMSVLFAADVTGLISGLATARDALSGFAGDTENLQEPQEGFISRVRGMGDNLMGLGDRIARSVVDFTEMKFGLMGIVQTLVGSNAQMEQTQIAFNTLFHQNVPQATAYLKELWNFAAVTPFQFQNIAQSAQQMIAFGFNTKQVIPDLTSMGNVLSALGRTDPGSLQQIVSIFGRMQAAGKVNARDMMEFTFMGIPAWKFLADAMHLTVAQVQELSMKGKLASSQAIPELIAGFNHLYGGAMMNQAHTFNGLLTTVKDNLQAAWRTVSGPLFDAAKQALVAFGNLVASPQFAQFAATVGKGIAGAFAAVGSAVGAVIGWFQHLDISSLVGAFNNLGMVLSGFVSPWKDFAGSLGSATPFLLKIRDAFTQIAQSGINKLTDFVNGVAMGFSALFRATKGDTISPIVGIFKQLFPVAQQVAGLIGGELQASFAFWGTQVQQIGGWFTTTMLPAIQQAMPSFQKLAGVLITVVVPALAKLWVDAQKIIQAIIPIIIKLGEVAEPIFLKISAFIAQNLAPAIAFLVPYVVQAAGAVADFVGVIAQKAMPVIQELADIFMSTLSNMFNAWNTVWPYLSGPVTAVFNMVIGSIKMGWALISGIFKTALDLLSGNWSGAWKDIQDMFSGIWDGMQQVLKGALNAIIGLVNDLISGIDSIGIDIGGIHIHPNIPKIPLLAMGGFVAPGGMGIAGESGPELIFGGRSGASVIGANQTSGIFSALASGGGNSDIHNHIYIDGRELTQLLMTRATSDIRLKSGWRR